MLLEVRDLDRRIYRERLAGFLPRRMIDVHTHLWLRTFVQCASVESRSVTWPSLVAEDNSIEDLVETYELLFPEQSVTPLVFGSPRRDLALDLTNQYVSEVTRQRELPGLMVSTPEWSAEELERRALESGFLGLKPYLAFAPPDIAANDITIFDFLPRHQLEVANAHGWIVMLHIPRRGRLRDPTNLAQMIEIERCYPGVRLIIAHIGRAYCGEDVGNAFEMLRDSEQMAFDFSANTNARVMEQLIRAVGPRRVLFGSDLPILRMRMRRVCEEGTYVNLVPPGMYGDLGGDPHMREVTREEGERLTFFMYEELLAFRRAAEATHLGVPDLEDTFYNNAARLVSGAGGKGVEAKGP